MIFGCLQDSVLCNVVGEFLSVKVRHNAQASSNVANVWWCYTPRSIIQDGADGNNSDEGGYAASGAPRPENRSSSFSDKFMHR